uniref:Secreted protein n=1 Tax=Plectus sambesii TaxID=2011161 RepID=A0A914VNR1_9BILA
MSDWFTYSTPIVIVICLFLCLCRYTIQACLFRQNAADELPRYPRHGRFAGVPATRTVRAPVPRPSSEPVPVVVIGPDGRQITEPVPLDIIICQPPKYDDAIKMPQTSPPPYSYS